MWALHGEAHLVVAMAARAMCSWAPGCWSATATAMGILVASSCTAVAVGTADESGKA